MNDRVTTRKDPGYPDFRAKVRRHIVTAPEGRTSEDVRETFAVRASPAMLSRVLRELTDSGDIVNAGRDPHGHGVVWKPSKAPASVMSETHESREVAA